MALATLANGKPAALAAVRLSATDAFFVAYQQRSGILMQLGGEVDLEGSLERPHLEQMVSYIVEQWPRLGQCLDKTWLGLKWAGSCHTEQMLRVGNNHNGALAEWRNKPIDPFREPPFQVLWIPAQRSGDPECGHASNTVAFRAHHSAMDGESFVAVTMEAAHFLSCASGGRPTPTPRPAAVTTLKDLVSAKQLLRRRRLAAMWGYTRWLAAEARAGQSTRLKVNAFATGDTHICERRLDCNVFVRLKQRATATRTAATWLCAAAWMRAIHAWNISHDATSNPNISLEFPVSLRHGQRRGRRDNQDLLGNYISPLVVVGDATRPLEQLARELRKQLIAGIRNQAHLGTPLITAPGKFLPWNLFQRVAVNPRTTGFATSHFTWFEQPDVCADIARLSGGALRVTGQRIYTPVCLHMGAALAVLASPNYAQIFLTYRETALSKASAERLVDLMLAELDGES
ncbi:MAG TPA: hypothetical protein VIW64_12130 [Pyrinomonadaceae bacterium]